MEIINTGALVIGSGFGAAACALRLQQAGIGVLMLERGPKIDPYTDFRQTSDPAYLMKYFHGASHDNLGMTWAEGYGGGSGFYEMVSLRAPSVAFKQTDVDGSALWPKAITRTTLDPYYNKAEQMLNVEQIAIDDVPKSGAVFAMLMSTLGHSVDRARYAVKGCIGSGFCVTGCIYGNKQSLLLTYLPQAEELGMQVLFDTTAMQIKKLSSGRYSVLCTQGDGTQVLINSTIVVLGGGTVGTGALLMRSREDLPDLSPTLNEHIAFGGSVKVVGQLGSHVPDGDMFSGRSHPGVISYDFLESHGVTVSCGKAMPLLAVTHGHFTVEGKVDPSMYWGKDNVEFMQQFRHRTLALYTLGMMKPTARLVDDGKGRVKPELDATDEVHEFYKRSHDLLHNIFVKNNCTPIRVASINSEGGETPDPHFSTAHMCGSARMADDATRGVCDSNGQVFGYEGLYIADGASIPGALAVNPSLTILANAERIADGLVKKYGPKPIARL